MIRLLYLLSSSQKRLLNLCSSTVPNSVYAECFPSILHCFQHPCRSSSSKGEISNARWSGWLQALYAPALSIFQVGSGEWEKMGGFFALKLLQLLGVVELHWWHRWQFCLKGVNQTVEQWVSCPASFSPPRRQHSSKPVIADLEELVPNLLMQFFQEYIFFLWKQTRLKDRGIFSGMCEHQGIRSEHCVWGYTTSETAGPGDWATGSHIRLTDLYL